MSKQAALSSFVAIMVALAMFSAGAGWWCLLVYAVDLVSYACGLLERNQQMTSTEAD